MWSSWYIVGLLLLITKRYAKKFWVLSHYLHAILGYFVLIVTIFFALKVTDWDITGSVHNGLGSIFVLVAIIGALSGTFTAGTMRVYNGDKDWAEKERVQRVAKIHRIFGYLMLLLGNVTVSSGIMHYYGDLLLEDDRKILGPISLLSFCLMVLVFEGIFRARNKCSLGQIATPKVSDPEDESFRFTAADIDLAVRDGRKLVVFDNLVLDLKGYERVHPGGKFNLLHNLGRDISKFFYGGYKLVNSNKAASKNRPHTHTSSAMDIVKTMVVGVLDGQDPVEDVRFRITGKQEVTENTATFTFTTMGGHTVDNLRMWYNDPMMLGKHFLVYSANAPRVKRHYTICSSMTP